MHRYGIGRGSTFRGKLMAELCGAPLVGHVVEQPMVCSAGAWWSRAMLTWLRCETLACRFLHDEPCRNDTVRLGMEAMDGCDTVTFVQGDQPLIRPASIAALLRAAERDAAGARGRDAARRDAAGARRCGCCGCDAVGAALADTAEDYAMGARCCEVRR